MGGASLAGRLDRHLSGQSRPPAVVFDCGFVNGLSAIRRLARLRAPVIAVDHRPDALGLRSRLALPVVCPDPAAKPAAFAEFLRELAAGLHGRAVAIPTHDEYLIAVSRAAEERLLLPAGPPALLEAMQAKRFQYAAAEQAGVGLPKTAYPESEGAAWDAAYQIPYPAVMKPSRGSDFKRRQGRPLVRAGEPAELVAAYREAAADEPMFQELIPGGDDCLWTVGSYIARDGRPLGVFCGRKLLQMPAGVGTCRVGEAAWDEDAVDAALRLLRELGFHGTSQVEFKRDPRDGRFKLMEVNARLWQWHGLAADCGVDLVAMAYLDALGRPVRPAVQRPGRRRWVALAGHVRESRAEGRSLRAFAAPLRPPFSEPVLSLRDPRPAVSQWYGVLRRSDR